ncbi:MAG: DNA replication/repair protein RecF [Pseudomonadota bacterium]|nr:DNA replication/repair protein RecF [Pseudomonadota bacterium]
MPIERLHVERIRNLGCVQLEGLQSFNVIYGHNGSGKSSILEAIHLLATGRSFRSHTLRQVIQHGQRDALILAQIDDDRIGVLKQLNAEPILKLNGNLLESQSELARRLPVQLIDPESMSLLDSGSQPRRQLLDWLMFHVEPSFHVEWLRYQRALRQRNASLKSPNSSTLLQPWNQALDQHGMRLHQLRLSVMAEWLPIFQQQLAQLLPQLDIQMQYHAGFDLVQGLMADLQQHQVRDQMRGHTSVGAHRADLSFKTTLGRAEQVLSRGQKKLLILGLRLSQLCLLHQRQQSTVVLLDDMTAELDEAAQQRLLSVLRDLNSQVFLTTLAPTVLDRQFQTLLIQPEMFHVEHGQVSTPVC